MTPDQRSKVIAAAAAWHRRRAVLDAAIADIEALDRRLIAARAALAAEQRRANDAWMALLAAADPDDSGGLASLAVIRALTECLIVRCCSTPGCSGDPCVALDLSPQD